MIIVNYYREEDCNPETDGYHLRLAGVINDSLDLQYDIQLITDCIDNDDDFEPKNGILYELQLVRATISADPIPEPAFAIREIIELKRCKYTGEFSRELIRI
jgi:hypothetical protein